MSKKAAQTTVEIILNSDLSNKVISSMLLTLVIEELRKIKIEFLLETDSDGCVYVHPVNYSAHKIWVQITHDEYDGFKAFCIIDFQRPHLIPFNFSMNYKNWQAAIKEYINKTK